VGKQYVFRMDDISWDMNYENFVRIRELFIKYDIRPIIGVIPKNEDPKLKRQAGSHHISQEAFWQEMRNLQKIYGWAIALHGYNHVYMTEDSGIFGINKRAEFAGLPYNQQEEKICLGKAILEENGLVIDAFMAPGHSLDWNTVEALKANDIFVVTDGIAAFPYRKHGVLFVPQVWPWPRKGIFGIDTVCFHINSWDDVLFKSLERFLEKNYRACVSFQSVVKRAKDDDSFWKNIINVVVGKTIPLEKRIRTLVSRVKQKIINRRK